MKELRKQFEVLPEIETHLNHGNVFWSDENKTYASEFQSLHVVACYVNGAWYAFQEQQKKIDQIGKLINYAELGYDHHSAEEVLNEIKEFLK